MMSHHLEEFVTFVLIFVDLYDQKMIRCVGVSFCCMCVFNLCFCFFVKHHFVPDYQTMLWCDGVSLWYFFMCVFNFSMFLCNIILLVLILFWMIWPIRRCLGVGDLYSSWAGVDPWVDTQCPLITPTLCIYVYIHYTHTCIYVVWHRVVCVARMMYGAPDIPKLRATLATSRRRHSLSRDWNICKCSQDDQQIISRKKHQEKRSISPPVCLFSQNEQFSGSYSES